MSRWFNKESKNELSILEEARLALLGEVESDLRSANNSIEYHGNTVKYHMDELEKRHLEKSLLEQKRQKLIEAAHEASSV